MSLGLEELICCHPQRELSVLTGRLLAAMVTTV